MKNTFISDLQPGRQIEEIFVISDKRIAHKKNGEPYLNLTLEDKTGRLMAVAWDDATALAAAADAGDFVAVSGAIGEYRGSLQLTVRGLQRIDAADIDATDFLPSTRRNVEEMFARLTAIVQNLETPCYRDLMAAFWQDEQFVAGLKKAPAAKKMHHARLGGLLEHTLSMAVLAAKIADHYGGVDRDLLLAGVILHDIGKIEEFQYATSIDYSDAGRLLGHIVIGIEMLNEKLQTIADFPPETALQLKHLILSHHGALEFGSPELPKTVEAVLLNSIDEIDSQVNGIRYHIESNGTNGQWSAFHRLWSRHFFINDAALGRPPANNGQ